jgi:hypothetical protein
MLIIHPYLQLRAKLNCEGALQSDRVEGFLRGIVWAPLTATLWFISDHRAQLRSPCQNSNSLWEETGVPGENLRHSVKRWLFPHESAARVEPTISEVKGNCSDDCDTTSHNNSPLFVRNRIFYFAHEIGQRWFRFALCKRNSVSATCNATSGTESSCYVKRQFNLKLRTCLTFYSADFHRSINKWKRIRN